MINKQGEPGEQRWEKIQRRGKKWESTRESFRGFVSGHRCSDFSDLVGDLKWRHTQFHLRKKKKSILTEKCS